MHLALDKAAVNHASQVVSEVADALVVAFGEVLRRTSTL